MRAPKRGFEFNHAHWLDGDKPMRYVVTKVYQGVVYYKPVGSKKAKEYSTIEDFWRKRVKINCSSLCHVDEPCMITKSGACAELLDISDT